MASTINADNGVVSGSSGVKTTADTSGVLALQSNGSTGITLGTDLSVTFAGAQTLSAGTANGVTYLNGSKVLTSGSALTFDGSALGLKARTSALFYNTNSDNYARIQGATGSDNQLIFSLNSEGMRLTDTGLGIGTSSPSTKLAVAGGISGTAGANISGAGWGVLPYVANSLVLDNNAGESRFFATGADATTDGSFLFYTGQTDGGANERFRIGTAGQLGIAGANYGTSGQVLTSGGSGAAPSWTTPGGGSWVYITTVTASGASTADVEGMDSTYDMYAIVAEGVAPASANAGLTAQFKVGGSYRTSSYSYVVSRISTGGSTVSVGQTTGAGQVNLTNGNMENATDNSSLVMYIPFAGSTTRKKLVSFSLSFNRSGDVEYTAGTGQYTGLTTALTGVRFACGSTISGTFRLYGIKNS